MTPQAAPRTITLTAEAWQDFLNSLYERDDRLERRTPDTVVADDEGVDAYTLSAHAEALRSGEVDGDVWETLEDIGESAGDEEEAWAKIVAFYGARDAVLLRVLGLDEPEEWLIAETLAHRLALLPADPSGAEPGDGGGRAGA